MSDLFAWPPRPVGVPSVTARSLVAPVIVMPLDVPFGTYHDGTGEAHQRMKARRRADQLGA